MTTKLVFILIFVVAAVAVSVNPDLEWLKKWQPDTLLKSTFTQADILDLFDTIPAQPSGKIHQGPNPDWQETLTSFVKNLINCPNAPIPGAGVVVVQHGQVIYSEGFGYRDYTNKIPVDQETLFGIGSCSKAFTSVTMSILKDRGMINSFDDIISEKYLPWFRMYDSSLSLKVSLRDMMSHRTGVPRNDLITLAGIPWTRTQLIEIFKYFPSNYQFRDTFEYNNFGFVTAGVILEQLTGETWESFVESEIFQKLNMLTTKTNLNASIQTGNYAFPYGLNSNGQITPYPPMVNEAIEVMCPAGCISSNLQDLANWLIFLLNRGGFNRTQIVSSENLGEAWKPSMKMQGYFSLSPPFFPVLSTMAAYGMGWWIGSYRDRPILMHGGNTIGHSALAFLDPIDNIGVFVLTNMEGLGTQPLIVALETMDLLLGYEPWLNTTNTCKFPCGFVKCETEAPKPKKSVRVADDVGACAPNLPDYVGTYSHPAYGTLQVSIAPSGTALDFQWGNFQGQSVQGQNDWFVGEFTAPLLLQPTPIPVQFIRNVLKQGAVESVAVPLEPASSPIIFVNQNFTPKYSCGFPQPDLP